MEAVSPGDETASFLFSVHHFATFAFMKTGVMTLAQRIDAFATLGKAMADGAAGVAGGPAGIFTKLTETLYLSNPWFTPENVRLALHSTGKNLNHDKLFRWMSLYPALNDDNHIDTVGVVMAGNIPLVGFHDLLCVLITGNRLQAKLSSKDDLLMRAVAEILIETEPCFSDQIHLTSGNLSGFDRVIATGSNNTSRYFEYYFRNIPSVIRHNRNSMAFIDGTESDGELELLGDDIFSYFGLGCRNVSMIYLPEGYDIMRMTSCWHRYEKLRGHHKYAANYDHNKAVMIVNRESFTDTGFLLLKRNSSLTPPMSVVNYEFYEHPEKVKMAVESQKELIQCVAGHGYLDFGMTQQPELWDYADDIDTISFLLKKNDPG
jgi:hypothetical protein